MKQRRDKSLTSQSSYLMLSVNFQSIFMGCWSGFLSIGIALVLFSLSELCSPLTKKLLLFKLWGCCLSCALRSPSNGRSERAGAAL